MNRKTTEEYISRNPALITLYAIFLSGYFLIPNAVDLYKVYIYAVLPLFLLFLRSELLQLLRSKLFLLALSYIVYMTASAFWSEPFVWKQFYRQMVLSVSVTGFIGITAWCFLNSRDGMETVLRSLWGLVCVNAAASIIYWYWFLGNPFPESRLISIGTFGNSNTVGIVYAVFVLVGLHFIISARPGILRHALVLGMALLLFAMVLTASRNAMVSVIAASLFLVLIRSEAGKRFKRTTTLLLGWAVALVITSYLSRYFLWNRFVWAMDHGLSDRLEIWSTSLANMQDAWLFGMGYLTPFEAAGHHWMHNIYLATLRDGGVIGLLLLLLLIYQCFSILLKRNVGGETVLPVALLFLAVFSQSLDGDQLLQRPKEVWLLFWFPVGMAVYWQLRGQRQICRSDGSHAGAE